MTTVTLMPDVQAAIAVQARRQGTILERLAADSLRRLFVTASPTPDEI